MIFVLKHSDTPLLRFSAENAAEANVKILWRNEAEAALLPLDLQNNLTEKTLEAWLRHKIVPRNRANAYNLLSSMNLNMNRPIGVIQLSKGLSLNDCYWVTEDGFEGTFAQFNLYDNPFNRILGQIAFTGYGSGRISATHSSPEFTTNGMLPKCWRHEKGVIRLYKGGTEGASNTGFEPYSEFYAAQIAEVLGVDAIGYNLTKWKGRLCSTCELFTSKERGFMAIGRLVTEGGMRAVRAYYESLGSQYVAALNDMIVFDAIICNVDRHFGNFGFLVDTATNRIVAPAPLFDHGNSLFNYAGANDITSVSALRNYANTLLPRVYDDFFAEAKAVLTHDHRESLRKLLDFNFKRHPRYNLDRKRLNLIEAIIKERTQELLW